MGNEMIARKIGETLARADGSFNQTRNDNPSGSLYLLDGKIAPSSYIGIRMGGAREYFERVKRVKL